MVKLVRNLPLEFPRELVHGEIPCLQYSAARSPKRYHEKPLLGRYQMLMVLGAGDHFGSLRARVYCNQQEKLFSAPVFFQPPLLTKEKSSFLITEEPMTAHSSILASVNHRNRGAWWAAVHGATKSRTGLITSKEV